MSDIIFNRRSIREYDERVVEDEKVKSLLKAGEVAPSACNQRPWEFYVVTKKTILEELARCSPFAKCVRKAPLAIVPCYKNTNMRASECVEYDLCAAVENILLEATFLGLGAVWLGIAPIELRMERVRNVLAIPQYLNAFAIISIGYPKKIVHRHDSFDETIIHYC